MRILFTICILIFQFHFAIGQDNADLTKVNKTKAAATQDQQEINRLKGILISEFLQSANNPKSDLYKEIKMYFQDYSINETNKKDFLYPTTFTKSNISVLTLNFNNNWGLMPSSKDTSTFDGNRNASLQAIVSIPVYDAFRRGYAINYLTFNCKIYEAIEWSEKGDNKLPIEKLPSYKKKVSFEAKPFNIDG